MTAASAGSPPALLIPKLLSAPIADAFLRTLWRDVIEQKVPTQAHQQDLLRKNALEIHGRNYAPLRSIHWGLTAAIADRLTADLLPSFAYFRLYFGGDICRIHSDRAACEVSASLTLGYSDGISWPLSIATTPIEQEGPVTDDFGTDDYISFSQQPGDAVLYYGSHYRHGRLSPNPNRWSAHLFLMWVTAGGAHEQEAFERLEFGDQP